MPRGNDVVPRGRRGRIAGFRRGRWSWGRVLGIMVMLDVVERWKTAAATVLGVDLGSVVTVW